MRYLKEENLLRYLSQVPGEKIITGSQISDIAGKSPRLSGEGMDSGKAIESHQLDIGKQPRIGQKQKAFMMSVHHHHHPP